MVHVWENRLKGFFFPVYCKSSNICEKTSLSSVAPASCFSPLQSKPSRWALQATWTSFFYLHQHILTAGTTKHFQPSSKLKTHNILIFILRDNTEKSHLNILNSSWNVNLLFHMQWVLSEIHINFFFGFEAHWLSLLQFILYSRDMPFCEIIHINFI